MVAHVSVPLRRHRSIRPTRSGQTKHRLQIPTKKWSRSSNCYWSIARSTMGRHLWTWMQELERSCLLCLLRGSCLHGFSITINLKWHRWHLHLRRLHRKHGLPRFAHAKLAGNSALPQYARTRMAVSGPVDTSGTPDLASSAHVELVNTVTAFEKAERQWQ